MKVLLVLEHYDPYIGGVEKLFKVLAQNLTTKGHSVRVITCLFDKSLPRKEIKDGIEIIRLPISNRYIFTFFGFFFGLKYSKGFDFLHTTSYNAALPGYLIGLFRGIPSIITFHEVWGKLWFKLPYLGFFSRLLFYLYEQFVLLLPFKYFVGVSDFTKEALLEYKKADKVLRIYNGLEYDLPSAELPKRNDNFLFFGRLGVSKGIDLLLGACKILQKDKIDFSLTMVIPTVPRAMFQRITTGIKESDLSDKITLRHNLSDSDLQTEIQSAKAVIIPSYSEGFCFAAAEVCALGAPLIHSGQGALKEVVSGKHIQMPNLSPDALASSMTLALSGKWDSTPLKKFQLEETVSEYINLYQSIEI